MQEIINIFGDLIAVFMMSSFVIYLVMIPMSMQQFFRVSRKQEKHHSKCHYQASKDYPVSILIPAYNEEQGILNTVFSLMNLKYTKKEIIIINDSSKDQTLEVIKKEFSMQEVPLTQSKAWLETEKIKGLFQSTSHPYVFLVDKENGGKADALNAGINIASHPYICSVDGDSLLDEYALYHVMQPIMDNHSEEVIASSGTIRLANGNQIQHGRVQSHGRSNNPLIVMQTLEYLRSFLIGRSAQNNGNLLLVMSGAFTVLDKDAVISVGGYTVGTIGEDLDLIIKLQQHIRHQGIARRFRYIPEAICYTEAPQNLKILRRQRRRWFQGLLEAMNRHKSILFNPNYGSLGLVAMPYYFIFEAFTVIVELLGLIYTIYSLLSGKIYYDFVFLFTVLLILTGLVHSFYSIIFSSLLERRFPSFQEAFNLILVSLTESFWYKPLTLFWRLEGLWHFLTKQQVWGDMERTGLEKIQEGEQV